jgi:hypothetical protein
MAIDNDLMDSIEAAQYIHVHVRTMEGWRFRGTGPRFLRFSNRVVRYRKADLDAFLQRAAVEPRMAQEGD